MTTRLLLLIIALLLPLNAVADWHREEAAIMGTVIAVELWHDNAAQAQTLINDVMDEMHRIDRLMSTYRADSELSRVNAHAASDPVTISSELLSLISHALEFSELTTGAFDITYASAGQYYDYRTGKRPGKQQLKESLPAIDYHHVKIIPKLSTVEFLHPGVRIDLGGIAKGYAVDCGIKILQEADINNALISAGGDTRVIGSRWDRPWNVGIRNPRDKETIVSMIPLENAAISTSGDYERYFEADGVRYHHILNPATGTSAHEVHSSSIIGTRATDTDALSTSVFVLGVKKGMELIDSIPDTEAIIMDSRGKLHYSAGLEPAT